jgi:hypothetical protein
MVLERPWVWPLTIAGVVGYIALATYFDRTYVELRPSGKFVLLLNGPFTHEIGPAYWVSQLRPGEGRILANIPADDPTNKDDTSSPRRSNAARPRSQHIRRDQ